jgi:hypothetical protein
MFRLDDKLARIRAGAYRRSDFIIADAKDPDMGPGLHAVGPAREADGTTMRLRTRAEFLDSIEAIVRQDIVDVMLTSVSNLEKLVSRDAFRGTGVKPAIRANDTTDVWRHRGAAYHLEPSRPFRTVSLERAKAFTDLGLYSITFTNDLEADLESLDAFAEFREDAAANNFSYFLEVFNPNVERGLDPETAPQFVNDAIIRCLAGLTEAERPRFLKMAYNGPRALEELASFDPGLVVGVLGGGAGTTRDCFELIHQAEDTARESRCSGARSISPNRRSTSFVSCARSPTGPSRRSRPWRPIMTLCASRASSRSASLPPTARSPKLFSSRLDRERAAGRAVGRHLVRRLQ